MQMTTEARAWLDATVRRILARHPLGDAERAGITYELMSHLHAGGEARAAAVGRGEVAREDLEAALAEAGGEDGLAAAFVQPLSRPIERVLFARRFGAFLVDALVIGIALSFVHNGLTFFSRPFFGDELPPGADESLWGLFPWGYHSPTLPVGLQALVAVASAIVVMGYFTWFEANEGRSLGKRALGLRVLRVDGLPMTSREAFIRNLAKLQPFVLLLDTVIMLLAFPKEKQRVSDRIAGTIVVRA
ncbi:MAG TPA: RDD family protein [Candidatus Thermoplasmatota archaeon]|nr:RDD family protein [Candidatus Thermoplasmatota archaeon]